MKNNITLDNIIYIYEKEISKNVKNKRKLFNFEVNKIQNITNIYNMLHDSYIGHNKYNIFLIFEPKCRLVMSLSVQDKIINHFVTRYSLEKNLSKYLDPRNAATRKGMGTDYAIRLVIKYINKMKCKYNNFYVLKMDISKYFYSIDHNVLKSLLKDKLDSYDYDIVCKIIDSTNMEYINKEIERLMKKYNIDIPIYNYGKGLPIGNMTSQFLSVFYLYKLDHFIVHDLKLPCFVRYMDDFIIISEDKEKLQYAMKVITEKIENEYLLKVNMKKTFIVSIKEGFSFLGYTYKLIDKKTKISICKSNYEKVKKRIKRVRYEFDMGWKKHYNAFCTVMTYANTYRFCSNEKIIKLINRYWYHEK